MRQPLWILLFVLSLNVSLVRAGGSPTFPDVVYGTTPSKSIKSWTRISVLGARDHLLPIVWIAPQEFEREYPELLAVLTEDEYTAFTKFIREKKCEAPVSKRIDYRSLALTEYSNGHSKDICTVPRDAACDYLSSIRSLKSIEWTENKVMPFRALSIVMGCEAPE